MIQCFPSTETFTDVCVFLFPLCKLLLCVCTVCVYIHQDMEFGEWSVCTGADWTLSESYNHWTLLDFMISQQKGVWCLAFYGKRLLISGSSDQTVKV